MPKLSDIDKNMRLSAAGDAVWHDPLAEPAFTVAGLEWARQEGRFVRFTEADRKLVATVNDGAAFLSGQPAGGQIRFCTDSPFVRVRAALDGRADLPHMPATGQCGADCYVFDGRVGGWAFYGATMYDLKDDRYDCEVLHCLSAEPRQILINLPLYRGLKSFEIGLSEGAKVLPATPFRSDKRLIVYGTSIVQGACASRPGACHTNILSRALGVEVMNFGFSGAAFGETEVARALARVARPGALVVDIEANAGVDERLRENLVPFIEAYRKAAGDVPLVIVSRTPMSLDLFDPRRAALREEYRAFQRETAERFGGVFLDASDCFEGNFTEYTVDGVHPTDYGFAALSRLYESAVKRFFV